MKFGSREAQQFTVVSLWGQLEAIQWAVAGWTDEEILSWLATKGNLTRPD